VTRIQARLHLRQTGYYGTYTKAAVSRFQRSLGWLGRGNCGPHTWHRLFG
jgi:peptidoglycan hydrolase-like protein with peptidoglycan-binding domain